jgi:dihydroxyacetone kinase-like protein
MSHGNISLLPFIHASKNTIDAHADEIAQLDQAIGDGDHLINLQRGIEALLKNSEELEQLEFSAALSKIGMTLMSTMGGASGSLFGSMFVTMGKTAKDKTLDLTSMAEIFTAGVESIKARGKADIGEKTMLDALIPASTILQQNSDQDAELKNVLENMKKAAVQGMESTKDLLATKGRASFLGERARGHIDAGARTSQLMLCAIADVIIENH